MKFRRCFIDEDGNIWREATLIEKSKDLPVVDLDLDSISLDEKIRWSLVDLRDYLAHYRRIATADLKNPIILRADGYVMNGWHRIIRAKEAGMKSLPSRGFEKNPEPDFRN